MSDRSDVIIVGAGFAGMYALFRMRGQGFNVVVLEAGSCQMALSSPAPLPGVTSQVVRSTLAPLSGLRPCPESVLLRPRAGITVPVPGAANVGAGFEHDDVEALAAQAEECVHAGKTGTHNNDISSIRHSGSNPLTTC